MILNLTQHPATPEQLAAGVVDITGPDRARLIELLTFNIPPSRKELLHRATILARMAFVKVSSAVEYPYGTQVMIGGAPYLMHALQARLLGVGLFAVYSFTKRVSEEKVIDGKVVKTSTFEHVAFVDPYGQHIA